MGFSDSGMSSKKRILLISCGGLGNGGVQAVIMNIVRNLKEEMSFDIVLTTNDRRYYDDEFESYGGKIFRLAIPKGYIGKRYDHYLRGYHLYRELPKILREGKYDAIHCNNSFDGGFCLKAAKKAGIPVRIMHTHAIHNKSSLVNNLFTEFNRGMINKYATHRIGCSDDACLSFYGMKESSEMVNNPYDSHRFVYKNKGRSFAPQFLQIGYFSDNKNQLFSLSVVAEIKKIYPDLSFHMIGFDVNGFLSNIKKKISELGLDENVVFHSHDADSPSLLADTDYLLFPSKNEGFGIVAIEAQAVGVKVFASDSVPHAINCGGVEFLPLSDGPKAWADAIVKDFEETGGEHAEYNCSGFSLENVMSKYRHIYGGE